MTWLNQYSAPDRQNSQYMLMCTDVSARMEYCGPMGPTAYPGSPSATASPA